MGVHLVVYPSSAGIDLPAWIEALAVTATLFAAIFLPRLDRAAVRKEEIKIQTTALAAIARRAKNTIQILRDRALAGVLARDEFGWLSDEAAAIAKAADDVDLMLVKDGSLIDTFVQVQEAARTANRRLNQIVAEAQPGEQHIPLQATRFDDPFDRVSGALRTLEDKLGRKTDSKPSEGKKAATSRRLAQRQEASDN